MRFRVNIPRGAISAAASSSIYVYQAGTTNLVAGLTDNSGNTLANPFTHPGGPVLFYMPTPARIQIGVQPPGAASPTVHPAAPPVEHVRTHTFTKSGAAASWILT